MQHNNKELIEHIYKIIISENLHTYIKGSDKYNQYKYIGVQGNCHCLIRDHVEILQEMEEKKWLKIISNTQKDRSLLLYPKFISDNKKFIIENFYELSDEELITAKFEFKIKKIIFNKVKKFPYENINCYKKADEISKSLENIIIKNKVIAKKVLYYIGRSEKNIHGDNYTYPKIGPLSIPRGWSFNSLNIAIDEIFIRTMANHFINIISDEIFSAQDFLKIVNDKNQNLHYLIGNGFSIGVDNEYRNDEIINRLSNNADVEQLLVYLKDKLLEIFKNLTSNELAILKNVDYKDDVDYKKIYNRDFQHLFYNYYGNYKNKKNIEINEIGIEDYFHILIFVGTKDESNRDLLYRQEDLKREISRAILNGNKALSVLKTTKLLNNVYDAPKIKRFFSYTGENGEIFTTNYDLNIETITEKKCLHIHGGFDVWYKTIDDSEIILRNRNIDDGIKLLSKKYQPDIILGGEKYKENYIEHLEDIGIERTRCFFDKLKLIEGGLLLFGFSGHNDEHINKNIKFNERIKEIIYIYHNEDGILSEKEKRRICEEFSLYDTNFYFINSKIIWDSFSSNN